MSTIDQYTDAELAAIAQRDIASIIDGETPATASTPIMAFDPETGRPMVVTVLELGLSMLENAPALGPGSPAHAARSKRALDLLQAIGYSLPSGRKRSRRLQAVAS